MVAVPGSIGLLKRSWRKAGNPGVRITLAITWPHTFGAVKESFEGAALVHGDVGRLMYVNKMT